MKDNSGIHKIERSGLCVLLKKKKRYAVIVKTGTRTFGSMKLIKLVNQTGHNGSVKSNESKVPSLNVTDSSKQCLCVIEKKKKNRSVYVKRRHRRAAGCYFCLSAAVLGYHKQRKLLLVLKTWLASYSTVINKT